jgi:predicted RNase H-like HicB family nuclease
MARAKPRANDNCVSFQGFKAISDQRSSGEITVKHHYKVDIRWSDDDKAWIARVPELDGVVTHGDTVVAAAKMAEEAIALHLESLAAHQDPIPEESALKQLSGKYPLRMGKERHMDVVIRATKFGMSVNEYLTWLIDQAEEKATQPRRKARKGVSRTISKKGKTG